MSENQEQSSQATEAAPPPAAESAPAFVVPDAYKDRGWVEKVKSPDDLWKTLDNAQSLLGKRPAGIPAADAPDVEWEAFYKAARPESPDKYAFSDVEGLPEGFDVAPYKKQVSDIMWKRGIPQKVANEIWQDYVALEMGAVTRTQGELDKRYDETLTKVFGDKREASEKTAQELINTFVPEDLKANVLKLSDNPEAMVGVIALANEMNAKHQAELAAVRAEYGAEGKLPDGGQQVAAQDIGETVTKLAKLRLSAEAQDFTRPGHGKVMQEISELQAVVAKHYNK